MIDFSYRFSPVRIVRAVLRALQERAGGRSRGQVAEQYMYRTFLLVGPSSARYAARHSTRRRPTQAATPPT
jgi:hypothetical protein